MKEPSKVYRRGPWQQAYKATGVLCADGVRRTVQLTREPDTFFSIPARLTYKGKTVTGFVWQHGLETGGLDLSFSPNADGKNAALLQWPD